MKRSALGVLTVVSMLLVFEVGFRLSYGQPWWERLADVQRPVAGGRDFGPILPGSLEDDVERGPKHPGTYRVLFLGDSFTAGSGVDDELTFVRIVERRLNARQPAVGIDTYQVANGGIVGSLTAHWVGLYKRVVDRFQPDLVVAVFFLRDGAGREVTTLGLVRDIADGMNELAELSPLYRYSYLYRFFRERSELQILSDRYLGILRTSYLGGPEDTVEWRNAQANLLWLKRKSERSGGRFALVVFPVLIELDEDYPLLEICDVIEGFAEANDIPVASLLTDFLGHDAQDLWISKLDQHPNEQGHALAAEGVWRFVTPLIRAHRTR